MQKIFDRNEYLSLRKTLSKLKREQTHPDKGRLQSLILPKGKLLNGIVLRSEVLRTTTLITFTQHCFRSLGHCNKPRKK